MIFHYNQILLLLLYLLWLQNYQIYHRLDHREERVEEEEMYRAWRAANRLIASEWCSRFLRRIYRITGNDVSKSSNDFANREIKGGGKLGNERVGEDDNSFPFLFSSTPKNAHFSRFHILFNYLLITLFLKIIYIRSNYFENKMEKKDILPEIDYSASIVIGFGEILIYAWTGLISD